MYPQDSTSCQIAARDALRAMADAGRLPGIVSASIIDAEQPDVSKLFGSDGKCLQLDYPGIIVWPFQQESTDVTSGNNLQDEIVYPVALSFVDKGSSATGANGMIVNAESRKRHALWRQRASRKFRHFLTSVPHIWDVYIRYQLYAIPSIYKNDDLFHGAIVVDFAAHRPEAGAGL